jgi:hypothetical protein
MTQFKIGDKVATSSTIGLEDTKTITGETIYLFYTSDGLAFTKQFPHYEVDASRCVVLAREAGNDF